MFQVVLGLGGQDQAPERELVGREADNHVFRLDLQAGEEIFKLRSKNQRVLLGQAAQRQAAQKMDVAEAAGDDLDVQIIVVIEHADGFFQVHHGNPCSSMSSKSAVCV